MLLSDVLIMFSYYSAKNRQKCTHKHCLVYCEDYRTLDALWNSKKVPKEAVSIEVSCGCDRNASRTI